MFLTSSQLLLHVNTEEWGNGYHALNKRLRKTREAISGVSGDRLKRWESEYLHPFLSSQETITEKKASH